MDYQKRKIGKGIVLAIVVVVFAMLSGCDLAQKPDFKTEYQAVLLEGGAVYYGKVDKIEKGFLILSDVFYFQKNMASPEGQIVMIKRGKEPHGPDVSYITTSHIVMIEPVKADSPVAKTIKEIKAKLVSTP